MEKTLKFKRGDKVRSMREGVTGTIVGYIEVLGADRMWVMDIPMTTEKQSYEGECHTVTVDESELMFVSSGEPEYSTEFPSDFKYELGTVVKHAYLTDIEGMIVSRRCHANGCFNYRMVLPTLATDDKKVQDAYFPEAVLIGDNVQLPFMTAAEASSNGEAAPKTKKGGPCEVVSKRMDV